MCTIYSIKLKQLQQIIVKSDNERANDCFSCIYLEIHRGAMRDFTTNQVISATTKIFELVCIHNISKETSWKLIIKQLKYLTDQKLNTHESKKAFHLKSCSSMNQR